ncbi:MAG: NAD(P) transhydrogenase subunit alpha [Acetobacteraceae bacterium]|nr:NAD(P) transhydrogenase subunit alpha [Acetobacteraceae bacterium]
MTPNFYADQANRIAAQAHELAMSLHEASTGVEPVAAGIAPVVFLLAVFLMACFVGYYVVWNVTPALHSPLMAVTNAISSVIIVGAMLAAGFAFSGWSVAFGFIAVLLASVNIFGGFVVTQRMLAMFQARKK